MALEKTERGVGLELVEREVTKALFNELNDELDLQQTLNEERDAEWNQLTGQNPSTVTLDHVETENFMLGHRPSLVKNATLENFPNISVMVYGARPTSEIIDQATNLTMTVDIEFMVKGDDEAQTNAKGHRMLEAIHQVMARNEGLGGLSFGWDNDPIIQLTDLQLRKSNVSHGEEWIWQAGRIRYTMVRHARLPSS